MKRWLSFFFLLPAASAFGYTREPGSVSPHATLHRNPTGYAQVLEEQSSSGAPTVRYTYGLDLISQDRAGTLSYYGYDGQGTVRYLTGPGSTSALVTGVTAGTPRTGFSGWVGLQLTVGSTPIVVTELGRWVLQGNSQSHVVKLADANGTDLSGGAVTVSTSGATPNAYAYAPLAAPLTLNANTAYYVVCEEVNAADEWLDCNSALTTTSAATVNGAVYYSDGIYQGPLSGTGHSYVPVGLKYSSATPTVTDTYTYDAFGIQIASSGSTANSYRYAGEQWDADLGMYYLRARYYQPELGRFWTMDSFEGTQTDPLSLHKYLYAHCDPVNRIDPSGHDDLITTLSSMGMRASMWAMSASRAAVAFRWSLVALNGIALVQDPGAFVSMGPTATADFIAADMAAIYSGTRGLFRASRAAQNAVSAFEKLAAFRVDIGAPPIALDNGAKKTTTAMLDIGGEFWIGRRFLGRSPNRAALNPELNPNNITRTHAEADVFNQTANAGVAADRATIYVDRDLCGACGQRGGVKSMARSLGIKEITIVTPSGSQTIVIDPSILPSTVPTAPVGLLYEILADFE